MNSILQMSNSGSDPYLLLFVPLQYITMQYCRNIIEIYLHNYTDAFSARLRQLRAIIADAVIYLHIIYAYIIV